jgi:RimJ/RimL family protein N-acetyltransferase
MKDGPLMPFELQPTLRGELLELRPLEPADFDALFAVASDPLVWEQHPVSDRWKPEVFSGFFGGVLKSGGGMVAIALADGRIAGSSRFDHYDETKSEVEIGGTFLARSHWGGIYNREMKRLMLSHAFRFVNRVIFVVGANNLRSLRAMEKIGGKRVGTKMVLNIGEHCIYAIDAADFRGLE